MDQASLMQLLTTMMVHSTLGMAWVMKYLKMPWMVKKSIKMLPKMPLILLLMLSKICYLVEMIPQKQKLNMNMKKKLKLKPIKPL